MLPLTADDLLPLDEYVIRRREYFDSHRRYIDRYRRVRIGPRLTLIFENRQTLLFRVQEIVRIARISQKAEVNQELSLYNRLLPGRDLLQAALLIEISEDGAILDELARWQKIQGSHLNLRVGDDSYPSFLVTSRPEDRCAGTSHWVQFHLSRDAQDKLADAELPAIFTFDDGDYCHDSPELSADFRQSLVEDLQVSERDQAG